MFCRVPERGDGPQFGQKRCQACGMGPVRSNIHISEHNRKTGSCLCPHVLCMVFAEARVAKILSDVEHCSRTLVMCLSDQKDLTRYQAKHRSNLESRNSPKNLLNTSVNSPYMCVYSRLKNQIQGDHFPSPVQKKAGRASQIKP